MKDSIKKPHLLHMEDYIWKWIFADQQTITTMKVENIYIKYRNDFLSQEEQVPTY